MRAVRKNSQDAISCSKLWRGVLLLGVTCIIAPCLAAQNPRPTGPRWEAFEQLGGSFFTFTRSTTEILIDLRSGSTITVRDDTSYPARARLFTGARFHLTPNNHIELNYSYTALRVQRTLSGSFPGSPASGFDSLGSHITSLNYVRSLQSNGRFRPLITAGLGVAAITSNAGAAATLAGNVGAGFDVNLIERLSVRFENRVYLRRLIELDGRIVPSIAPSVGFVFRF